MTSHQKFIYEFQLSIAISFQQVNAAPYAERASEYDNESLKSIDCRIEKIHIYTFLSYLLFHNFLLAYCNYEFTVLHGSVVCST